MLWRTWTEEVADFPGLPGKTSSCRRGWRRVFNFTTALYTESSPRNREIAFNAVFLRIMALLNFKLSFGLEAYLGEL
jgi:hypothetical protein